MNPFARASATRPALSALSLLFATTAVPMLTATVATTNASATTVSIQTAAVCPRGTMMPDGCTTAPANGSFIVAPSFAAYARQSHQSWVNNHPWAWNAAGVDYPVGYSRNVVLQDPATATLPPGCAYLPTGGFAGGPKVYCDRLANRTGVVSPTIQNMDFSLHGCTVLEFTSNVSGTITVANNNFKNGPNCAVNNGYLIKTNQGSANLLLEYNQIDGDAAHYPAPLASTIIAASTTGSVTLMYNAIVNSPQRPMSTSTTGNVLLKSNYVEGWTLIPTLLEHGGVLEQTTPAGAHVASVTYAYNTTLVPASAPVGTTTAAFTLSGRPGGHVYFGSSTVDHNVVVTNLSGGVKGAATTSGALAYINWGTYGTVTITNNYVDPTGSMTCIQSIGGGYFVTGSISGNTLTVSSVGTGALYAGAIFRTLATGMATAVIRPYGTIDPATGQPTTGRGGPGTYVLSGSPQHVSFTVGNTQTSPIASRNVGGNYSLVTGAPIIGTGGTGNGGTCPPLF